MTTKTYYIRHRLTLLLASLFFTVSLYSQIHPGIPRFKNGVLPAERNIARATFRKDSLQNAIYKRKYYVLLQFDTMPDAGQRKELAAKGIRLFDYIPDKAFLAELKDDFSPAELKQYAVSGISRVPSPVKMAAGLRQDADRYLRDADQLIGVSYFGTVSEEEARQALEQTGAVVIPTKIRPGHVLFVRAGSSQVLSKIAALPYVSFVAPQSVKSRPLNYNDRAAHGADALGASSGRSLLGDGMVLGIGDQSPPTHVDFTGRLINRNPGAVTLHGSLTAGTMAGAGIADPRYKGMAPHATIISQLFSDILPNAPIYLHDYDMVLTNNSYGNYGTGCGQYGDYDFLAYYTDAQLYDNPTLLHSFASGNAGAVPCAPYTAPYNTLQSGFQCAKNALTVGSISNFINSLSSFSSSGPTNDGRVKPEIVAGGSSITSAAPGNTYVTQNGTSLSTPAVTGTLALIVQRYRQLNGGADPPAALIKALACNTATDMGNPGPDYLYGFGSLNARAAVEAMESGQYFINQSVANGDTRTFTLSGIPSGLFQIKIMLYWPDVPAAPFAATTLVNDLDLTVTSPDAIVHQPLILNPALAHLNDNAVEGADHLNNIEQVVINNPPGGTFTVTVNGTNIPATPTQNFVVTYQLIQPSVTVEYPFGNETIIPNSTEIIRWNAYGGDPNPFTIEYSTDNGSSWSVIDNNVPATSRIYNWTVPATITNQGLIRVTRNSTSYSGTSQYPFTVLDAPSNNAVGNPCPGYAQLTWDPVASATSYDILQLKGSDMVKIGSVPNTSTSYLVGDLNRDSTYWLAVQAINGSTPGRRSTALPIQPNGGPCTLSELDNDYTVDSLIGLTSGRLHTSSELSNSTPVTVELKNLGTIPPAGPFNISYRINGGTAITESVSSVVSPNGGTANYTFTQHADLSAAGSYLLEVWTDYPGDPHQENDTLTTVIRQLNNDPITLASTFTEGLESAAAATYLAPTLGFSGLDRCDFFASNGGGRVRTFVNTGFARTGANCATLDRIAADPAGTADSLIMTFNLSNYSASDQIWLDFYYKNHGIDFGRPGNEVWIRGDDQSAWIPVYALDTSFANIGVYQPSAHINVTSILKNAVPVQTVSSSFQVKFGEEGFTSANSVVADANVDDGYSFDDITLSRSTNDISVDSLAAPSVSGICALSNAETISIKVKNNSSITATNIPVTYSINGVTVTETIPSINPFDSVIYSFTQTADLSAFQPYTIIAWSHYAGDNYSANDSLTPVNFRTSPVISSFPYLEGFEADSGYWYTGGINSSWALGTPAKTIIDKAANGTRCWVTSLAGHYNDGELSYLYSPCFNVSGLTQPVLSFSHIFQTEDNCDCDYHWVEYSTDGVHWTKLGTVGNGTNWYDNASRQAWQLSDTKWHVSSYDLPTGLSQVKFRFVMNSDPGTNYEGVGIDDIHIFDKAVIYSGADITSGLTRSVSGNGWIDFSSGGQRVASINPNGQDLGSTTVKVFINTGGIRNDGVQYYLDRNIVIQPTNAPTGNVSVRFYFLDVEALTLMNASGCGGCTTIVDPYEAGVTQYSSTDASQENGTLADNSGGTFTFHRPRQDVTIYPYDNGYYAEYSVSGFSEFWLNNGGPSGTQPLPLTLLSFTAIKAGDGALLQWSTTHETRVSRFVIEKSSDGSHFTAIDSVASSGDSLSVNHYRYTDPRLLPGVNYYRLRMTDLDDHWTYSSIRTVKDADNIPAITIYPNPVTDGYVYINSPSTINHIQLQDLSGRIVLNAEGRGNNSVINARELTSGIYFIIVDTDAGRKVQKLIFARPH